MTCSNFVLGIDGSKHQGEIDFRATQSVGMKFALLKATEGVGYQDPSFAENWKRLLELDGEYIRGAYHFARPDTGGGAQDGEREAQYFSKILKRSSGVESGCFPPVVDFEKYSAFGPKENIPWMRSFVHVIEMEFGRKPMIYTGRNIWKYEMGNTDEFIDCPLWQVDYTGKRNAPKKTPWIFWTLWQYSGGRSKHFDFRYWMKEKGKMPGIRAGFCDVNRFNGTLEELYKLALVITK